MYSAGTIIGGKYELERAIAEGGMALVYRGMHRDLGRTVAVKFIFMQGPNAVTAAQRFLREARVAASVRHRNVIDILDVGIHTDGQPYMVMELLEGKSLEQRFSEPLPMTAEQAVAIISLSLRGLAAVHDAGIVHRDIKPDNIFLVQDADGVFPKLLDFGVSRVVAGRDPDDPRSKVYTSEGLIVGTPQYMSPEQARGMPDIDIRTDIWSTGAILFEALTGVCPFDAQHVGDILVNITTKDAPPVLSLRSDVDPRLSAIVAKALSRNRDQRYASAREMRDALTEVLDDLEVIPRTGRMRVSESEIPHAFIPSATDTLPPTLDTLPPGLDTGPGEAPEHFADARAQAKLTAIAPALHDEDTFQGVPQVRNKEAPKSPRPVGGAPPPIDRRASTQVLAPVPPIPAIPAPSAAAPSPQPPPDDTDLELGAESAVQAVRKQLPDLTDRIEATQVDVPARPPRAKVSGAWIAAGVAVTIALTLVVLVVIKRQRLHETVTPPATAIVQLAPNAAAREAPTEPASPPAEVTLHLRGVPPTAEVRLDGTVVPTGPIAVPRGEATRRIEVRAAGFKPWLADVSARADTAVEVRLEPDDSAAATPTSPTSPGDARARRRRESPPPETGDSTDSRPLPALPSLH